MKFFSKYFLVVFGLFNVLAVAQAIESDAKIGQRAKEIAEWAKEATLIEAVKAQNTSPDKLIQELTQDQWESLTILDEKIRYFQKSKAGQFLKAKKLDWVSEAFVSDAEGRKVGFLEKTSSWSHDGKAKHDKPMNGETWKGNLEFDESAGVEQVQISVPILEQDKPIGSLVVGIDLSK